MNGITILQGDVREVLKTLPDESVHCVVTSPPYWGLRDYGVEGQIGLESSPSEYLTHMVDVFREVRRTLRDDGTLWVNMGDSYASGDRATYRSGASDNKGQQVQDDMPRPKTPPGLKPKDLVGMPWRLAFALQADGWFLRQDIIWHKPNPMPESVRDRCTKAHEYIFLLAKFERYYYDFERILEPVNGTAHARGDGVNPKCYNGSSFTTGKTAAPHENVGQGPRRAYKMPDGWDTGPGAHGSFHRNGREKGKTPKSKQNESFSAAVAGLVEARNKRSIWTVPTQAFPEAHFATFPEELIKPCVLAGCPAGGTVLDPFFGSGTTGLVARAQGCKCIGIELNPDYIKIAERRLAQEHLEFTL
jgi:DNA modification methylase